MEAEEEEVPEVEEAAELEPEEEPEEVADEPAEEALEELEAALDPDAEAEFAPAELEWLWL